MILDGLYVDIGACMGEEIQMALDNDCDVIAFEPHPISFRDHLVPKFGNNDKVFLQNAAAWDQDGKLQFYSHRDLEECDLGSTVIQAKMKKTFKRHGTVQAVNIGRFLKGREVGTIKIDAEGAEYRIIESLLDNNVKVKHWYVEDHERKIPDKQWKGHKENVLRRVKENNITLNNWE